MDLSLTRAGKFLGRDTQAIRTGRLEQGFLAHTRERWPRFDQLADAGKDQYPAFPELLTDIFMSLYLLEPQLREASELKPSHQTNRELLEQAMKLPVWVDARRQSALHRLNTMLGLVCVAETLLQEMPEPPPELPDELISQLENAEGEDLEGLLSQLEAIQGEANPDQARRVMKKGLKDASDQMEEFDQAMRTWGVEPGELQQIDPAHAMALYDRMRKLPNLKQFTDELGKMRQYAYEATKQHHAREMQEIVDVTTGGSWQKLLPNERLGLLDPDLEALYLSRFFQHGSLSWVYAGRESAGMGPFICCLDVSGSTGGSRERWGKGFALAALDMARRQQRDVGIIFFDSRVLPEGVFSFPKGYASLEQKIAVAEFYTGGGTNFEIPLQIALNNITDGNWPEADIVLVTDGEYRCSESFITQFREACAEHNIRVHGVLLDHTQLESLVPICDQCVSIASLAGPGSARTLYSKFVGGRHD